MTAPDLPTWMRGVGAGRGHGRAAGAGPASGGSARDLRAWFVGEGPRLDELHGEYAALNFPRPGERPARTTSGAAGYPVVQGHCPACGLASLFLGSGGYVTCASLSCTDPTLASDVLAKMPEPVNES